MAPVDFVEQVNVAVIGALNADASLRALCGRTEEIGVQARDIGNVREKYDGAPVVGYAHLGARPGLAAIGEWRTHVVEFNAEAADQTTANALLHYVEAGVTCLALAAVAESPLDAHVLRQETERLGEQEAALPNAVRVALRLTLHVKHT